MTDKALQDLAVAYAQAKLIKSQQDHPEEEEYDLEVRSFLKSYYFALLHLPEEDKDIDLSTLI